MDKGSLQSLLESHTLSTTSDKEMTFHITSLSLLSSPDHTSATLVTMVTVNHHSSLAHSFVLVHSVEAPPPAPGDPMTPTLQTAAATAVPELVPLLAVDPDPLFTDISPSPPHTFTEDTPSHQMGQLSLISVHPLSKLLSGYHDNFEVKLTRPLTSSELLAVYVGQPHPPGAVELVSEVRGHGCLAVLRYNRNKEGGVVFVPVVRRVMGEGEDKVVDMCPVAVGDGEDVKGMLVVMTTRGNLQILNVESLEVLII